MKEKKLEVGVKYRGYGLLNEFGEFEFVPEDTGSRIGKVKAVTSGDGYSVSSTKKFVLVHLKVERELDKLDRVKKILRLTNILIDIFRKYEF